MGELAQQAYHTWLASLYGSKDAAFLKGVKTWQNLPEKAQQAWEVTVEYIKESVFATCVERNKRCQNLL